MDWSPGSHGPLTHWHSLCFPAPCGDLRDSHLPLLSPFTPGRPWLSRGTKRRKAAFSSADDQPCGRYYSRPPCQFPFFRPRDTGTTSSLLPGSPTHSRGPCSASPAVGSGARWCLGSSHSVEKLLVSSTLSPNERKQAPKGGPGSLDGPSRKDGWAQSSRVPSPNPCCQLQLLPNSSFSEAAKLEVSSEPRPPCPLRG